jgi:hypothetical protein
LRELIDGDTGNGVGLETGVSSCWPFGLVEGSGYSLTSFFSVSYLEIGYGTKDDSRSNTKVQLILQYIICYGGSFLRHKGPCDILLLSGGGLRAQGVGTEGCISANF